MTFDIADNLLKKVLDYLTKLVYLDIRRCDVFVTLAKLNS